MHPFKGSPCLSYCNYWRFLRYSTFCYEDTLMPFVRKLHNELNWEHSISVTHFDKHLKNIKYIISAIYKVWLVHKNFKARRFVFQALLSNYYKSMILIYAERVSQNLLVVYKIHERYFLSGIKGRVFAEQRQMAWSPSWGLHLFLESNRDSRRYLVYRWIIRSVYYWQ